MRAFDDTPDGESEAMTSPVESETVPDQLVPVPVARRRGSRFWREVSGALAIGLCALAVAVLGFQVFSWLRAMPGPGPLTVGGHLVAAALAVFVQRFADRLRGWAAAGAVLGVLAIAGATMWIFWWA